MKHSVRALVPAALAAATLVTIAPSSAAFSRWRHATSMCRAAYEPDASNVTWNSSLGAKSTVKWPLRTVTTLQCGADYVSFPSGELLIAGVGNNSKISLSCTARVGNLEGFTVWSATNSLRNSGTAIKKMLYLPPVEVGGHFSATCSLPYIIEHDGPDEYGHLTWFQF